MAEKRKISKGVIFDVFMEKLKKRIQWITKTVRLTSYDTDCATERTAPINEYLLFLPQPAPNSAYTPRDDTQMNQRTENFIDNGSHFAGYTAHRVSGTNNVKSGIQRKTEFLSRGQFIPFDANFIKSAKGTSRPVGPGLFGPLRFWI